MYCPCLARLKDSAEGKGRAHRVRELRLRIETVLSCSPQRDTVSSTFVAPYFSFALRQTPFKTQWLIIYPGNEMPKPGETHHQERKGHSHPAHRYTLNETHSLMHTHTHTHTHTHPNTHTTMMDGNNFFIGAWGRQSFHPRVRTASRPRAKQKLDWWGEIFKKALI